MLLNGFVFGALVGGLVVSAAYPRYVGWQNSPSTGKALCECGVIARQTADQLLSAQMLGCAVGSGLGAIGGLVAGLSRRRKRAVASS